VTLRGNVLAIGGLNEKLLAAKRHGATTVLVPDENRKDVDDVNPGVKEGLRIVFVKTIDEALPHVFRDAHALRTGKK
jgi:ATP-dependent Lon protease